MTSEESNKVISKEFCSRDTLIVAKELLGCILNHKLPDGRILSGIIVETEAYKEDDPACHAYKGKTPRAATLFKEPALSYVYLIYGMYHCFNVVTEPYDTAGAVLVRALEPIEPLKHTHGPGRLCKSMFITKEHNEIELTNANNQIWITKGNKVPDSKIVKTTRIGIKLAQEYPWRFYIKGNKHVSILKK